MNINYELYKIFFVVANSETITDAAKKLYISQPAITKSIKNLEEQLNITLFIRNTKGTKLTNEGKQFYNQIKPAIEQLLIAENEISSQAAYKSKNIIIGINDIIIQKYLTKPLKKLLNRNNVNAEIKEKKAQDLIDNVTCGKIDIAILPIVNEQSYNQHIETTKLFNLNICLFSTNTITYPTNIDNIKIISNDISIIKNLFPQNYKNSKYIIVDSYYQIYELVNQKFGLGIMPKEFINKEKCIYKPINHNNIPNIGLYIIINKNLKNKNANKLKQLVIEEINNANTITN